jgi:hypothetical protein
VLLAHLAPASGAHPCSQPARPSLSAPPGLPRPPAPQVTFRADLTTRTPAAPPTRFTLPPNYDSDVDLEGPAAPALATQAHYEGSAHVSRPGFESDEWIPARLVEFSEDCFGMLWFTIDSFSVYTRLELPEVLPPGLRA